MDEVALFEKEIQDALDDVSALQRRLQKPAVTPPKRPRTPLAGRRVERDYDVDDLDDELAELDGVLTGLHNKLKRNLSRQRPRTTRSRLSQLWRARRASKPRHNGSWPKKKACKGKSVPGVGSYHPNYAAVRAKTHGLVIRTPSNCKVNVFERLRPALVMMLFDYSWHVTTHVHYIVDILIILS